MDEQTSVTKANDLNNGLSLSSLPSLSPQLNSLYKSLNDDMRRIFIKVYGYLWSAINGYSVRSCGVVSYYWLFNRIAASSSLSPSSLVLLSYLYMMTNKGSKLIHSSIVYNSGVLPGALSITVQRVTWDLKHAGYITRHTKDPGQLYNQRAQHNRQPVYIKLSSSGVALIEGIEKDINKLLLNTSLNDLTGVNKKA
ncbi:MAG: hypothetical protein JJE45_00220 [Prolixibacteraceae bacterium]|nr:hypothetical protein [Prolixibacteraceae bacterium]